MASPSSDQPTAAALSRRSLLARVAGGVALGVTLPSLSACAETPPAPQAPAQVGWSHKPPITLAAMGPEVLVNYVSPRHDPNVEHLMPLSPEQAIRTWARERLQCNGFGTRTVRVVVDDASVIEVPLETKGGLKGFFTDEPETRYDAKAVVSIQLVDDGGTVLTQIRQEAWRSRSINEKSSIAERERAWSELIELMMQDLDGAIESGIRSYFGDAVVR
ncbi:hypothetical protein [Insolitispirillum peregrinum]|uniref:Uncharacterized protein n=1 Tax=Insolitispirillum peregrinum TaxID=80876 RepID=A0A1N7P2U0_9PROT|nr:hypothetical protein [Insolitispirillum peregrinum]SIT04881.1 hypothetical protein SAMN05421779_10619 [Insolitispirillum peregrinum]